jgi:3-methyladenine DNA glycosylase/8-oxoguanine DNA glycosylase
LIVNLENSLTLSLFPSTPFHFDATFFKPDHFPSPDNTWQSGARWQTMRWENVPLGLKFENQGEPLQPEIRLTLYSAVPLEELFITSLLQEIRYRYSLDLDLNPFYHRFENDERQGGIIRRFYGMRDLNCNSLYEYLIIAIILQNATVRRSVSMMGNLLDQYGDLLIYDNKRLFCFWEPETIAQATDPQLRLLKVGYRAKSILRVTEAFTTGEIEEQALREKPYHEQRAALLSLYGVGPASVGYILSAVFHHLDELQHISPWEQKIYSKLFFNQDPDQPVPVEDLIAFLTDRYGGFRAIAIHYHWEDLFWKWKKGQASWLDPLIRL